MTPPKSPLGGIEFIARVFCPETACDWAYQALTPVYSAIMTRDLIIEDTARRNRQTSDQLLAHLSEHTAWRDRDANAERISLAKHALVETGHFSADEVSDDIAPRIIELNIARCNEIDQLRAKVAELSGQQVTVHIHGPATPPADLKHVITAAIERQMVWGSRT